MPLADLIVIADEEGSHNPWRATFVKDIRRDRRKQHKHWRFARKKIFVATKIWCSKSLIRRNFHTIPTRVAGCRVAAPRLVSFLPADRGLTPAPKTNGAAERG
jgi:hypothetical protein